MRRLGMLLGTMAVLLAGCGSGGSSSTVDTGPLSEEQVNASLERAEARDAAQQKRWEAASQQAAKVTAAEELAEREAVKAEEAGAKKKPAVQSTEGRACGSWPGPEKSACELSYAECSIGAKVKVEAYYGETGPDLDALATDHAERYYGHSGASKESSYAGCLAAFMDEYDRLYR